MLTSRCDALTFLRFHIQSALAIIIRLENAFQTYVLDGPRRPTHTRDIVLT